MRAKSIVRRVRRRSCGDHFRLDLLSQQRKRVVIDLFRFSIYAVVVNFVEFTRKVGLVAVCEMAAVCEVHR